MERNTIGTFLSPMSETNLDPEKNDKADRARERFKRAYHESDVSELHVRKMRAADDRRYFDIKILQFSRKRR
jgi:hypothetical protein